MKKIVSLLLVCLMVFSLAACSDSGWQTKNMKTPAVKLEMQESSQVDPIHNIEIKDMLIVSPLKTDKYNPDAAIESIKKLEFTKGWVFERQYSEQGTPYFHENGQTTAFIYGDMILVHEDSNDGMGFILYYSNNTDEVIGYATIAVEFIPSKDAKNLSQKQMLEVMNIVFGEEYAKYLCYAKMEEQNGRATKTITNGDASLTFDRTMDTNGYVGCAMSIMNTNEDSVKGYGGDFNPHMDHFAILAEILHWNVGDNALDVQNMGKNFLAKYYGEGAYFEATSGGYGYTDDGTYKNTSMRFNIAKPDLESKYWSFATMDVCTAENLTEMSATFQLGELAKNATDEERAVFEELALQMAKDILMREDVEDPFNEDTHFNLTLTNGTECLVIFRLNFEKDNNGNELVLLSVATTTDLTFFDKK